MIIDISPPITPDIAVFPGDTPMSREVLMDRERGDHITLSTLRTTVHVGAHADGPNHYEKGGLSVDQVALDRYLGPCQVVRVVVAPGGRIGERDVPGGVASITEPRVLFRTDSYPEPDHWTDQFVALEPSLVHALAAQSVVTIGVDTPSVDSASSKALEAHTAFAATGLVILEGLALEGVEPGRYELIALPLRLVGFDGSPVRAVLRTLDDATGARPRR